MGGTAYRSYSETRFRPVVAFEGEALGLHLSATFSFRYHWSMPFLRLSSAARLFESVLPPCPFPKFDCHGMARVCFLLKKKIGSVELVKFYVEKYRESGIGEVLC